MKVRLMSTPPGPSSAMNPSLSLSRPSRVESPPARLSLGRVGALHQPRIVRAHHERALRVACTLINVMKPSLLRSSGPSSSVRPSLSASNGVRVGPPTGLHRRKHQFRSVGVDARHHVDHRRVEPLLDGRVCRVALRERVDQEQRQLAPDQVIALEFAATSNAGRWSTGVPAGFASSTAQMSRPSRVLPIDATLAMAGFAAAMAFSSVDSSW